MLVKIGSFPRHFRSEISNRFMNKKYGRHVKPRDMDWQDRLVERLDDTVQQFYNLTLNQITSRMNRKIKVRIDRSDVWSADHTLSYIILPVLKKIAEDKHGAPGVDDEDVPDELRSVNAKPLSREELSQGAADEFHFQRWDWVLNEMIYAFECINNDEWESQLRHGTPNFEFIPVDRDGNVVSKDDADFFEINQTNNEYWVDRDGIDLINQRIANGTRLFGKYYRNLWT